MSRPKTRAAKTTPSGTPTPAPILTEVLLRVGCVVVDAEALVGMTVLVEAGDVVEVVLVVKGEVVLKRSKSSFNAVPFPGCCWQPSDIACKSTFHG